MSAPLTHPERVAVSRLHALLELLPTELDKRLAPAGVTSFEHTLLTALVASPEQRLRMSELARKTNATLPRISRVASSLERRGLVARSRCPEDGRATNAELTTEGASAQAESERLYNSAVRELILSGLGDLPGDGVAQLTDLTYAVLTSLDTTHSRDALSSDADPAPCEADPAPCLADPVQCAADPAPCDADPEPCESDPAA